MIKNYIVYFLCKFSLHARVRRRVKSYKYMQKIKTIVLENGTGHEICLNDFDKVKNIFVKLRGRQDKTNQLIIELPQPQKLEINLLFNGQNNIVRFGENCFGKWGIASYQNNNKCSIGKGTSCSGPTYISLINNDLQIGENCMFSNNIHIWGDGHSVLSWPDKKVVNIPVEPIKIGNHCWVGERVTLTKNAQIPDDCIVGIASVVTKKFEEGHVVLAGAPAKIVRRNVTWDGLPPMEYEKLNHN